MSPKRRDGRSSNTHAAGGAASRKKSKADSRSAFKKALNPVLKVSSSRSARRVHGVNTPSTVARLDIVDAARGFAIMVMIAYHFCFDLTYFGWTGWRMLDDAGWIAWRDAIVTTFVFLVGVSLALRDDRERRIGAGWFARAFVLRWLQIAGAATLVTAGSFLLFPDRFIYFGVLHFVAVALWLCRRAPRWPLTAFAIGVVALIVGNAIGVAAFDARVFDWIGFASIKPPTEDYVPLCPWIGVTLIGCALGGVWTRRGTRLAPGIERRWHALPVAGRRMVSSMGRYSLAIYLVHQPLLFGVMGAIKRLV